MTGENGCGGGTPKKIPEEPQNGLRANKGLKKKAALAGGSVGWSIISCTEGCGFDSW